MGRFVENEEDPGENGTQIQIKSFQISLIMHKRDVSQVFCLCVMSHLLGELCIAEQRLSRGGRPFESYQCIATSAGSYANEAERRFADANDTEAAKYIAQIRHLVRQIDGHYE